MQTCLATSTILANGNVWYSTWVQHIQHRSWPLGRFFQVVLYHYAKAEAPSARGSSADGHRSVFARKDGIMGSSVAHVAKRPAGTQDVEDAVLWMWWRLGSSWIMRDQLITASNEKSRAPLDGPGPGSFKGPAGAGPGVRLASSCAAVVGSAEFQLLVI